MTNETLTKKLNQLCVRYILDTKRNGVEFKSRVKNDFYTIINFLDYYFEEDDEFLIVKRSKKSKYTILQLNKKEILDKHGDWRMK